MWAEQDIAQARAAQRSSGERSDGTIGRAEDSARRADERAGVAERRADERRAEQLPNPSPTLQARDELQ